MSAVLTCGRCSALTILQATFPNKWVKKVVGNQIELILGFWLGIDWNIYALIIMVSRYWKFVCHNFKDYPLLLQGNKLPEMLAILL